jgi:HK97 family phage major capsid protein
MKKSNWMRGWLMLSVVIVASMFSVPIAMASMDPMLVMSSIKVDKFNPKEQPNFWLAGLGTIGAARSSKRLRELQAKKAAAVDKATAINAQAAADNDRDLTVDEEASFKAAMAEANSLQSSIDREIDLLAHKADDAATASASGRVHISVHDNAEDDPVRGFRSFGDFAAAVKAASLPHGAVDERLRVGAAAPGTYSSEGVGADGGFAVPPQFSSEIWRMSLGEGSLLPLTQNTEVSGNSMVFPKDETTPWGSSGVQAYWRNEGPAITGSKLQLSTETLRLHELTVLVPVTNELLDDAAALASYIPPLASERIQWKTNESILFGTGAGQPQGALNSAAAIVVAKESGQATLTLSQPNISKMRSRLLTGNLRNAIWLGTPDILPALEGLTVGNIPIFLPPGSGLRDAYDGTLNGRPLILSEHAAAFSSQGDLNLLALNGYRTITKAGGIDTATSMHLYFDANATAFRFIFRIDGKPILSAPVTPPKSSNTRSHFVSLGAR